MTTPLAGYAVNKAKQAGLDAPTQIRRRVGEARKARLPTGNRQYQGVILAEFLVAVLIVGVAPLARGKGTQDTSPGPSPYGVDDIKQLAGIGAVYFILALLSSGKRGRFAAWFGGLILVAIGLSQTTSGGLPAIFGIFQPASQSAGPTPSEQFPGLAEGAAQAAVGVGQRAAAQNPTAIFPTITPELITPTQSGQPTFTQQVTQGSGVVTTYQGGQGVITTNTGTQLA